mgnify:CR=1 FL=1
MLPTKAWQQRLQPWLQLLQGRQEGLFHTCAIGSQVLQPPFQSVSQIESTVRASMLDLTNSFSGQIRVLKTAQQSEKESGCAIPKENINRTSTNVDEEHFLVDSTLYLVHSFQ